MSAAWEWLFGNEAIAAVQQFFGLGHPLPFRAFSLLGDTWGVLLAVGVALWLFGRRAAYPVVGIVVVGAATKLLLSSLFQQTRPEGPGIVVYDHLEVSSFPSGHVYAAVGPWGLLFALGFLPFWVPVLVTLLVGLGRIYLGAHYVGDVVGGVAFGVPLVWAFARVWPAIRGWLRQRGRLFFTTLAAVAISGTLAWMTTVGPQPRRYEVFGLILGAAVGLPVEYRLLRYRPGGDARPAGAPVVAIGLLGIGAFLLLDRRGDAEALLLGTVTAGLATLWAVLGAPWLFRALNLAGSGGERGGPPRLDHNPFSEDA